MPVRHREEVLNTVLAQLVVARGLNANPEAIKKKGAQKPDVLIVFRGLRCAIEGKIADVANARQVVLNDAQGRVDSGLAQIAIAIVYAEKLRRTALAQLTLAMAKATYDFLIYTEVGTGEWQTGAIDDILNSLRRAHDVLSTDDAVKQAADELTVGLNEIANVFLEDAAVCDRLVNLLGIGSKEKEEESGADSD
jgi:hypothetical protein